MGIHVYLYTHVSLLSLHKKKHACVLACIQYIYTYMATYMYKTDAIPCAGEATQQADYTAALLHMDAC
jgi:hypothetical protein